MIRLAFVRALFARLDKSAVVLYRGFSCRGQPRSSKRGSFVSSTFSLEVAMSHFNGGAQPSTGVLFRQSVPIERVFMSFLETAQMNRQYKEAEAVLLFEEENDIF